MSVAGKEPDGAFILRPRWIRLLFMGAFLTLMAVLMFWDIPNLLDPSHRMKGRASWMNQLPPLARALIFGGTGLVLAPIGVMVMRLAMVERLAVISAHGIEVQTAFGIRRAQWPQILRVEFGIRGMIVLRLRERHWYELLFLGGGAIGVSSRAADRSQDEILAMIARYRPDLLPGVVPWQGPASTGASAGVRSSEPIEIDSRGWTG